VSTSPAAPPAWLEAAAKLDALLGDKVPLADSRSALPPTDAAEGEQAAEKKSGVARSESAKGVAIPTKPVEDSHRADSTNAKAAHSESVKAIAPKTTPVEDAGRATQKPKPRIAATQESAAETGQEVELAWRGYSPAALLPSTIALVVTSATVYFALRPFAPTWIMHESVDAPLIAVWMLQLIRAVYRLMAYNYRLTSRRLFRERGRLYPPEPSLDLATVAHVDVVQTWFCRWAGVGMVKVVPEEATPSVPTVELAGIRRPGLLASRIEAAAKAAREGNVTAVRAS
jgi:membrane protein YdbS with pleckstrin-like domain